MNVRRAGGLALLAALGLAFNFGFQWYLLVYFGAGELTDALLGAMAIPQFAILITSGPLVNVLIPILSVSEEGRRRAETWTVFFIVTTFALVVALSFVALASLWVPLLLPGLKGEQLQLAVELARVQTFGLVMSSQYAVVWAYSHAQKRFVATELALVSSHIIGLVVLYFAVQTFGIRGAAWTNVFRPLSQVAFLIPALGMPVRPDFSSPVVKEGWRRLRPLLLGAIYFKSEILVDRLLSSLASAGGLSLFFFARQLYNAANGILSKAVVAPIAPELAQHAGAGRWTQFRALVRQRFLIVLVLVGVGYLALVLVGRDLLSLLIGYGGVTENNLETLYWLLLGLGGMIGSLGQIISSSFYAYGDTGTPTRASIVGYTIGIGFKVGGFLWLGLFGLALGISAYYFLNLGLLMWLLGKGLRERAS